MVFGNETRWYAKERLAENLLLNNFKHATEFGDVKKNTNHCGVASCDILQDGLQEGFERPDIKLPSL